MKVKEEGDRQIVEYEDGDRKIYTGAERFIEPKDDFEDKIPESRQTEDKEKMKGLSGYKKLSKTKKKEYLKEKIK